MIKALLFLTALGLTQGAQRSLTEPHPDCPASGHWLLPHEYDCTKFYYCDRGEKFINPTDCPANTEFSVTLQVCTHAGFSGCTLPGSTVSPSNPTVSTSTSTQAPTAIPDAATTPGSIELLENGCPADSNIHMLLPHESSCQKFYYCVHGNQVLTSCGPGTVFNFDIQNCDHPYNVNRRCEEDETAEDHNVSDSNENDSNISSNESNNDDSTSKEDSGSKSNEAASESDENDSKTNSNENDDSSDENDSNIGSNENDSKVNSNENDDGSEENDSNIGSNENDSKVDTNENDDGSDENDSNIDSNENDSKVDSNENDSDITSNENDSKVDSNENDDDSDENDSNISSNENNSSVNSNENDNDSNSNENDSISSSEDDNSNETDNDSSNESDSESSNENDNGNEDNNGSDSQEDNDDEIEILPNGCPIEWSLKHLPHEHYCSKSYQCVYGSVEEKDCPVGTHFSYEVYVTVSAKKKKPYGTLKICVTC